MPVMLRPELIQRLAAAHPTIHRLDIAEDVEIFFAEIAARLARGERVELRGFGIFTPKTRKARRARNPATGDAVEVGTRNYLVFHAGSTIEEFLPRFICSAMTWLKEVSRLSGIGE